MAFGDETTTLQEVPEELLDTNGFLNDNGKRMLVALMRRIQPGKTRLDNPQPGDPDVFAEVRSRAGVPVGVEAIIYNKGNVLVTWREDTYWKGWHLPGTYLDGTKHERIADAVRRCGEKELGTPTRYCNAIIGGVNHRSSPRIHDVSLLCWAQVDRLGEIKSDRNRVRWLPIQELLDDPSPLISCHRQYPEHIFNFLRTDAFLAFGED